jgi:hypothetical protein
MIRYDFSQAVLNSIYNKRHYMEVDIRNVYRHGNTTLGPIYRPNQKTKLPLWPNTMKTAKLG